MTGGLDISSARHTFDSDKETVMSYDIKVEDVEYIRHGGTPLLARLYRPGA